MKQKILYILMMITALIGGNGEVWAQEGYKYVTKSDIPPFTVSGTGFKDKVQDKKRLVLSNTTEINENAKPSVTFTIGDNIKTYQTLDGGRIQPYYNNVTNTVSWSVPKMYYISLKSFSVKMDCSLGAAWNTGGYVTLTAGNKSVKSGNLYGNKSDVTIDGISLGNSNTISMTNTRNGGIDVYFYIYSVSYTYTLSYYELDIYELNTAITDAEKISENDLGGFTKTTFTNALEKANTVKEESVFPTSYWDGSNSQGKQNPTTVNNATSALRGALELANAYLEAKAEINNLKAQGNSWPKGLSVNVDNALTELDKATDKNGINNAKNNAKNLISIILERNLPEKKFFTLTLPFDYNLKGITDGTNVAYAAQLALVTHNEHDCYTLYFKKVEDGQMRANQPYIVWLPVGFEPDFGNVGVHFGEEGSITVNGWTMQGNYSQLSMTDKFGIAEGVFRKGGANSTINAYTAYFIPPTHSHGTENVRARVAVMDEAGNTTYIGEVKDLDGNAAEEVFGIDGMRLPEMRKGINIVRQKDGSVRKIVK